MAIIFESDRRMEKREQHNPIVFHKQMDRRRIRIQDFSNTGKSFFQKALSLCDPEIEHQGKTATHLENK
jgi:hypothetical protein